MGTEARLTFVYTSQFGGVDEYGMIFIEVPVAQWIEHWSPEPVAQVRFLSGTLYLLFKCIYPTFSSLMFSIIEPIEVEWKGSVSLPGSRPVFRVFTMFGRKQERKGLLCRRAHNAPSPFVPVACYWHQW